MLQFIHHSGLEPFANDSDQATIGDALFEHPNQPVVINVIKEPFDVRFDDPSVLPIIERFAQFLSGLARSAPWPVSDAFVFEVVFPNRFKDHLHGLLYDLVF